MPGHAHTLVAAALLAAVVAGCTSVGFHDAESRAKLDFGEPDRVALCVYVDAGIDEQEARQLIADAWDEEARLYALSVDVVKVVPWQRRGFMMSGIIETITRESLAAPCDRVMALVNRNLGDVAWNLLQLPEVLGAVNDETLTHGYTVARRASVNQLFMSPATVARHEIYHMLGCDEHFDMDHCYRQIARLKRFKHARRDTFFPAWDAINKRIVGTRDEVNARLSVIETPPGATAPPAARVARRARYVVTSAP
jgi:hypothetical protein